MTKICIVFMFLCMWVTVGYSADKLTEKGINREANKMFSKRKPRANAMPDLKAAEAALAEILKYENELKEIRFFDQRAWCQKEVNGCLGKVRRKISSAGSR